MNPDVTILYDTIRWEEKALLEAGKKKNINIQMVDCKKLAINLEKSNENHGEAYNFGPSSDQNYPVSKLIDEMSKYWDQVKWNDISKDNDHVHEAGLLKLNCDKALFDLDWHSTLEFEETVKMTVEWYKHYYQNSNHSIYDFTLSQIDEYTVSAKLQDISWSN